MQSLFAVFRRIFFCNPAYSNTFLLVVFDDTYFSKDNDAPKRCCVCLRQNSFLTYDAE